MSETITHCAVCGTHWSDVELMADGKCATCLQAEIARLREELRTQIEWGDAYHKSSEEARDAACWLYTVLGEASCEAEVRAAYREAERRWGTWLVSGE